MLKSILYGRMSAIGLVSGVGGACVDASIDGLIGLTVGSNVDFIVSRGSVGTTVVSGIGGW
jgi:hypothetical protein